MLVIESITPEILKPMNEYRDWVFSDRLQASIGKLLQFHEPKLRDGDRPCSPDTLAKMNHDQHEGVPDEFLGINLNSDVLKIHVGQIDRSFLEEARDRSHELDRRLQHLLGAKVCALKMFYPRGGYIPWHTNWDSAGYNVIFTYSLGGDGYWRHIDPTAARSVVPNLANIVQINDRPGWNCKAGYFGRKDEVDKITWHCAYTREPRLTLSYLVYDKNLWENLVEELRESV